MTDLEIEDIRDAYAADGEPGNYLKRAIEFDQWLNKERARVWGIGYGAGQDSIYTATDEWPNPGIRNPYEGDERD